MSGLMVISGFIISLYYGILNAIRVWFINLIPIPHDPVLLSGLLLALVITIYFGMMTVTKKNVPKVG